MTIEEAWDVLVRPWDCGKGEPGYEEDLQHMRDAMLAVLDEARGTAGHFKVNPLGSCFCRSCEIRQAIQELGKEPA